MRLHVVLFALSALLPAETFTAIDLKPSGGTVGQVCYFETAANGSNKVCLTAPASLSGDVTFKWPTADGSAGEALTTDGAGQLYWSSAGIYWSRTGTNTYLTNAGDSVGINTSTPTYQFTVESATYTSGERFLFGARAADGSVSVVAGYRANGTTGTAGILRSGGNKPLDLGTTGTPQAVRIENGGNVGIGTTSPTSLLHVNGAAAVASITIAGSWSIGAGGTAVLGSIFATDFWQGATSRINSSGVFNAASMQIGGSAFVDASRNTTVNNLTIAGTCTGCGAGALPVVDTTSIVEGSADGTKEVRIEADGITTGTVRVWTAQDANITVAGINHAQTWTATQTFQHIQFPAASTYDIGDSTNYVQTLYVENINAAPASVVANYTKVRKLEITDQAGGTTFWDFQVSQSASASSLYYVRDNAGTTVHRLVQTESSSAINQAQFLLHLVPGNGTTNADNTYDLGSASRSWRTAYIDTSLVHSGTTRIDSSGNLNGASLQIGGTQTINSSREWASGNFLPSIDNSYRVGNGFRRWIDFYASTGYYILDNSFVVRLNADGNSVFGRDSSGTTQWTISTTNGTMEVLNWYIANGTAGITATKTVRDSAGTGTCTLVFTGGIYTGGSC